VNARTRCHQGRRPDRIGGFVPPRYRDVPGLVDLSPSVAPGEVVGILGLAGCSWEWGLRRDQGTGG